jgi:predicted nucleic acid-binding protein
MDAVLLDTDVFSYLTRNGDARGDAYRPHIRGKTVAISFITVGEVYFGAEKRKWGSKTLGGFLERLKAVVVVPSDDEVCTEYGRLKARLQKAGIVVADNDLWIAACALRHSVPLISNNRKHFEKISGLQLISLALEKAPAVPTKKSLFDRDREE